jgi:hypothetical protein
MTNHKPSFPVSAPDHRTVWQRATELDRQARGPHPEEARSPSPEEGRDLSVPELLDVAREVGISPDSVLITLAQDRLADGGDLRPRETTPLWHLALVETVDALEVSLRLAQEPGSVLSLLDRVLGRPTYRMELEDRIQVDPSEASVSVFRASESGGFFGGSSLHGAMEVADGRVLIVSVVAEPGGGSRLRIRMPAYERGTNLVLSAGAGGLAGVGGTSAGAALGEMAVGALLGGATGLLPIAAVVGPAVLGAYMGVGLGILGFRRLQKWGFRRGQIALNRLARVLEMEARDEVGKGELPAG